MAKLLITAAEPGVEVLQPSEDFERLGQALAGAQRPGLLEKRLAVRRAGTRRDRGVHRDTA